MASVSVTPTNVLPGRLLTGLATGVHGQPPASITVISGDVHHSYLAAVDFPAGTDARSAVYQAVCSPIHNMLPRSFHGSRPEPRSLVVRHIST
jgi:hypothetical protein